MDEEKQRLLSNITNDDDPIQCEAGSSTMESTKGEKLGVSQQTLVSTGDYGPSTKVTQYIAALSVTLGAFAMGTVLAWTSPADSRYEEYGFTLSTSQKGWVAALMALGCAFICWPIAILSDKFGRKPTMLALIIPFTIGWCLVIWADSVLMLYFGRFITGMAGGAFCVTAPMYNNEIAQKEIRGALGSYFQLMVTIGILFVYIVGSVTTLFWLSIASLCIPILFGICFVFQPETPKYLVKKGKIAEAEKSLLYLRGKNYNIRAEIEDLKKSEEEANRNQITFKESLKKTATQKALLISFGVMFFQQLSGINAVIFFSNTIFKDAKSTLSPETSSILLGTMQVIATFVASLIIDRLGRRILLLVSDSIMALCALSLGIFLLLKNNKIISEEELEKIGIIPIISLCLFIIVFSLGYGPIPWMIIGEVLPSEVKTIITSAACTFNWLLAFIVTKFFNDLVGVIKGNTFFIFAAVSVCGTIFVFFIIPETKGKSLDEIQVILSGEKPDPIILSIRGLDNEGFARPE